MGPEIGSELGKMIASRIMGRRSAAGLVSLSVAYLSLTVPTAWLDLAPGLPSDERWFMVIALGIILTPVVDMMGLSLKKKESDDA